MSNVQQSDSQIRKAITDCLIKGLDCGLREELYGTSPTAAAYDAFKAKVAPSYGTLLHGTPYVPVIINCDPHKREPIRFRNKEYMMLQALRGE